MIIKCQKCGYSVNILPNELRDYLLDKDTQCPICSAMQSFKQDEPKVKQLIPVAIDKRITAMQREIEIAGNNVIYGSIECIKDCKRRLKARAIFLKAGGMIPSKEL